MNEHIDLTISCFYEGSPVAYRTIMEAADCTADDITQAVKAGLAVATIKRIGAGGRLLRGLNALHVVPAWA